MQDIKSKNWMLPPHRTSPGQRSILLWSRSCPRPLWAAARGPCQQPSPPALLQLLPAAQRLTGSPPPPRRTVRPRRSPWGTGQVTPQRQRAATVEPPPLTRRTPQGPHRTSKVREATPLLAKLSLPLRAFISRIELFSVQSHMYAFVLCLFFLIPCLVVQTWLSPVGSVSITGTSCWASSSCPPAYRSLRVSHPSATWCWTRWESWSLQICPLNSQTPVHKPPSATLICKWYLNNLLSPIM